MTLPTSALPPDELLRDAAPGLVLIDASDLHGPLDPERVAVQRPLDERMLLNALASYAEHAVKSPTEALLSGETAAPTLVIDCRGIVAREIIGYLSALGEVLVERRRRVGVLYLPDQPPFTVATPEHVSARVHATADGQLVAPGDDEDDE